MRRDAGFDPSRADGDERESEDQAGGRAIESKGQMAKAVDQGQGQNGQILSEEDIGEKGTEDGKQIRGHFEAMVVDHRLRLTQWRQSSGMIPEILRHEDHEDRPHPVVTEPLGRFVQDDERDAGGHRGQRKRAGCECWLRHAYGRNVGESRRICKPGKQNGATLIGG